MAAARSGYASASAFGGIRQAVERELERRQMAAGRKKPKRRR